MKAEDWIKVEDRLPKDGQMCLIVTKLTAFCYKARWNERHRVFYVDNTKLGFYENSLSYWMPIVLPKEEKL